MRRVREEEQTSSLREQRYQRRMVWLVVCTFLLEAVSQFLRRMGLLPTEHTNILTGLCAILLLLITYYVLWTGSSVRSVKFLLLSAIGSVVLWFVSETGVEFFGREVIQSRPFLNILLNAGASLVSTVFFSCIMLAFLGTLFHARRLNTLLRERQHQLLAESRRLMAEAEERQRAELELRDSEEKFSKVFQSSPAAICIALPATQGRILDVNRAFTEISGFSREEAVGRTPLELGIWADPAAYDSVLERLRQDLPLRNFEFQFRRKDGVPGFALLSVETCEIDGQAHVISSAVDITERHLAEEHKARLEEQLRQSQKMEAVGQLAGGVAHDFNNLLQVILGYSDLLSARLASDDDARRMVGQVYLAAERAAKMTRQLLAFSRRQVMEMAPLNLNDIARELMGMLQNLLGAHIELSIQTDDRLELTSGDQIQVEQMLLNLCINARDAMPSGGLLSIETGNVVFDALFCKENGWAEPGRYVGLKVRDTGCGIDDDTLKQIFEPFFTTKSLGEGTGLGLAMAYGIVKQHRGFIRVESKKGAGTVFHIYLPVYEGKNRALGPAEATASGAGKETILVADDENMVLSFTARILENAGYTVLQAHDGEEALKIAHHAEEKIDLALLDIMMPKMGGREVERTIRANGKSMRFLFCSGYNAEALRTHFVLDEGMAMIEKPFIPAKLLAKVREVLDA